jgi:hypothetical protein
MAWGGGILILLGYYYMRKNNDDNFYCLFNKGILILDPGDGWWGLNLGRALMHPMEAYYHSLFFASIYYILKQQWKTTLILSAILSLSHPFTGIEYLLIIATWFAAEYFWLQKKTIPLYFGIGIATLLICHLYYYLIHLNKYPQHKTIFTDFSLNWGYDMQNFVPAYLLVFLLAAYSFKNFAKAKQFFANTHNRLFIIWAIVAFALANHEFALARPMQPIHFTRGYIWSALFLLAIPAINNLLQYIYHSPQKILSTTLATIFISLMLLDNISWFYLQTQPYEINYNQLNNTIPEQQLYQYLNTLPQGLVLSDSKKINFLTSLYTNKTTYLGHDHNTPYFSTKRQTALNYFVYNTPHPSLAQVRYWVLDTCNYYYQTTAQNKKLIYQTGPIKVYQAF